MSETRRSSHGDNPLTVGTQLRSILEGQNLNIAARLNEVAQAQSLGIAARLNEVAEGVNIGARLGEMLRQPSIDMAKQLEEMLQPPLANLEAGLQEVLTPVVQSGALISESWPDLAPRFVSVAEDLLQVAQDDVPMAESEPVEFVEWDRLDSQILFWTLALTLSTLVGMGLIVDPAAAQAMMAFTGFLGVLGFLVNFRPK